MQSGYEKALGAALADDLKAPAVTAEGISGWAELVEYENAPKLPAGTESFAQYVKVPGVLNRRIDQVGLGNGVKWRCASFISFTWAKIG